MHGAAGRSNQCAPAYVYTGLAAGLAVLCKYSGAFLVGGLGLWIALDQRGKERWHRLAAFLLPAVAVAAPLSYAQFSTDFYLPQTLSTLSRIEDLSHPLSRLLFFAVSPLFFASPFLLFLLYAGLVRAAKQRDLLVLLPALCTIGAFLFFALGRGQIKGNWLLPGLLSLWPVAFAVQPRRWLLVAVVATGLLQALAIGLGLKYPGLYGDLAARSGLDKSYVGLVSEEDRIREPSYSWSERLCEYGGWRRFAADVEEVVPPLPLLSTQYSIPFALAYYGQAEREYYTVDDPRFRYLTDFYGQRKGALSRRSALRRANGWHGSRIAERYVSTAGIDRGNRSPPRRLSLSVLSNFPLGTMTSCNLLFRLFYSYNLYLFLRRMGYA